MIGLVASLQAHGDDLEADFQETYGLRLWRELAHGRFARVHRLTLRLPDSSRWVSAVSAAAPPSSAGPVDISGWPRTDRLIATVIDELAIANWQRGGGKAKKPELLTATRKKRRDKVDLARFSQRDIRAYLSKVGPQA